MQPNDANTQPAAQTVGSRSDLSPPQDVFTMWIFVFGGRTDSNSCHKNTVLFESVSEVELIMQKVERNQAAGLHRHS